MELAREAYSITKQLPKDEMYGLTSQIRRSAISIPSNIAEGHKRSTPKDFCQFLKIANGSAAELETQLLLLETEYSKINVTKALSLLLEVQKMLTTIIKKLSV